MELPIPRHLKEHFIPYGFDNSQNQVSGKIRCLCNGETFFVFSSNDGGIVKLVCTQCKKEILLFDAGKYGWNGFNFFKVSVSISSQGKEDFMKVVKERGTKWDYSIK